MLIFLSPSSAINREYNSLRADPVHVTEHLLFWLTDLEEMPVIFPCLFLASLNYLANKFTCLTVDNSVSLSCPLFWDRHNLTEILQINTLHILDTQFQSRQWTT
jgi:hypothetical protein